MFGFFFFSSGKHKIGYAVFCQDKVSGDQNSLVTSVLFCIPQKKESHTGLKPREVE